MDEDDPKEYRWETGYEKTWEALKEDDDGFLEASITDIIQRAKRKRQALKQGHQKLGMMRHLYLIIDCSEAMSGQDLKPTRLLCTIKLLEIFIDEFFDQNPISQLGILILHNKRCEKLSELTGNPKKHIKAIQTLNRMSLIGEPSLQNGLELAAKSLKLLPTHASREILVIMGSLTSCDPSDINATINMLKSEGIRCSVIGLAAEVRVCRHLATSTGGTYNVILDDAHYKDLLLQNIDPPPASKCLESSLIKMGFPHQSTSNGSGVGGSGGESSGEEPLTMCMCHIDGGEDGSKLTTGGYYCPQCLSKYCELPVECRACGLTLVSAPHLARSYHHLFPAPGYKEVQMEGEPFGSCFACQKGFTLSDKQVYQCLNCRKVFCMDCDIFVHDTLHTCPGCATNISTFQGTATH